MAGLGCVMLSGIPRKVRRPALQKHFTSLANGGGPIEYILHPLGNDLAKAVIKFTEDQSARTVLQHEHVIEGRNIDIAPLPRQVLSQCKATVDQAILAGLPDLVACMDLLRNDFGVTVHFDPLTHTMSMAGSFLQLQFAQAALSAIFREQEEMRQRALTEAAEKVLNVPLASGASLNSSGKYDARSSTPNSQVSEDFDSLPRTLRMEDLSASKSERKNRLGKDETPWLSTNSPLSTGRSVASAIVESSILHASSSSKFKPYASGNSDLDISTGCQKESIFTKNARAVDNIFSSSVLTKNTGPKPSDSFKAEDSTSELLNTWGSIDSSSNKVVVEFDTQVFNFMRRVHGQSLKDLERSYRVQLQYKKNGDVTIVRILPIGEEIEAIAAIHQAKNPLINLYHTVFKNVIKIVVSLERVSPQMKLKVDSIVAKIKESFKAVLYIDLKEIRKRLTLVGQQKHAEAAEEKLRKALDLKKDRDIIKPKMVFMMQSPKSSSDLSKSLPIMPSAAKERKVQSSLQASHISDLRHGSKSGSVFVSKSFSSETERYPEHDAPITDDGSAPNIDVGFSISSLTSSADHDLSKQRVTDAMNLESPKSKSLLIDQENDIEPVSSRSSSRNNRASIESPTGSVRSRPSPRSSIVSPRYIVNKSESPQVMSSDITINCSRGGTSTTFSKLPRESAFSPTTPEPSEGIPDISEALRDKNTPRVAWSTPEPALNMAKRQLAGNSDQYSVQTSMTGVTPLTSANLSATGEFSEISFDNMSQPEGSFRQDQSLQFSQPFRLGQSLDLQPQGSSTLKDTSRSLLDRISFMSSGDFLTDRSEKSSIFKFATKEGVKVSVYSGKITEVAADAIICPTREDMRLLHGVALEISQAAGRELQESCTRRIVEKGHIKEAESFRVAATGTLACQYVLLAACPMWCLHPEKFECEGILKQALLNSFESLDKLKVESVALPAIGTGEHGIPADVCSWALLAAIEEYSSTSQTSNLKKIYIVNSDDKITKVVGDTLEEVLQERASNQITPLLSPQNSRRGSVSQRETPFIVKLLAASVSITERAGKIIRDIMKKGELGIVEKGVNDLQTEGDRAAERSIIASLLAQFPGLTVVGEEGTNAVQVSSIDPNLIEMGQSNKVLSECQDISEELRAIKQEDVVVWVDPIDGTAEYTQGLVSHVTTLIGIAVNGVATAGVIHQPFYTSNSLGDGDGHCGRSIWGMVGLGSFGYDKNLPSEGKGNNVIVTTRSHGTGAVGEAVAACDPSEVLRAGGCGYKALMVIEGRAHAYVFASPGCKKWDTAAPEAILGASGGKLTDVHGNQLFYQADVQQRNSAGVVATAAGGNHQWYIDHIPRDVQNSLPEVINASQLADPRHSLQSLKVDMPFIIKLLAASVSIAERAGKIIRDIMKKGELGIVEKGVNDLQTEGDRAAERSIIASLLAQFPGLTVVGEEGTNAVQVSSIDPNLIEMGQSNKVLSEFQDISEELRAIKQEDVVVWVDPIDGTAEYTQGLVSHVTTLIGIAVNGLATAGVIHQPFYTSNSLGDGDGHCGRSIWGMVGLGSFGYDKNLPSEGKGNNVIVTTRSHGTGAVGEAVAACEPSEVLRAGGCGYKALMVIEGRAHAYVFASPGCKKWDTAAPEAILCASGGKLTDVHGNQLFYHVDVQQRNSAGVVATAAGGNHQWYIDHIPRDVQNSLPEVINASQLADPRHSLQSLKVDMPFIIKLLAASVSIAERAGKIIRDIMKKGELGIVEKGVNDLQTEGDRAAERSIIASLLAQFPGLTVVGEEGTNAVQVSSIDPDLIEMGQSNEVLSEFQDISEELRAIKQEDVVVWVDPIDGTAEYTQGLVSHVTTLIGIAVNGLATAGVIHQPFYTSNSLGDGDGHCGRSIWGMVGLGSFGYDKNLPSEGKGNNVIVTTRSHGTGAVGEAVAACEPSEVLRAGGCGYKALMVIEGRAHAYVFASPGCKKWDTAAPEAILCASGGKLTDVHGNQLFYQVDVQQRNSAGVVATAAGGNHQWYIDHIPRDVQDSLPEVINASQLADPRHSLQNGQDSKIYDGPVEDVQADITEKRGANMFDINTGAMSYEVERKIQLPGVPDVGALIITYTFSSFDGTAKKQFTAYLPNNEDGRRCLQHLRKAFDMGIIFRSEPSEDEHCNISWGDIPHKDNIEGGAEGRGYPDADYLEKLEAILREKGIPADI